MDTEDYISGSDVDSDIEEVETGKVNITRNRSIEDIENDNIDEDDIPNEDDDDDDYDVDEDDDDDENNEDNMIMQEQIKNNSISENIKTFYLSDEDEDSDDDNYLQKFQDNIHENIIEEFHPELKMHNYEEINNLSKVVRNENGEIVDPLHRTLPFITKYEKARVIGERSKQINAGAIPLISVEPNMIDGYLIALKEFEEKKTPFIIKRPLPNGGCEYWKLNDLEVLV
jgi:DNA-directed RNA polymerase I, II, and III subunit RPABC2